MKRIKFDEKTVNEIREYINQGHTVDQTCNRFTLKYDTLKRVMFENNMRPYHQDKSRPKEITKDLINLVCNLYEYTDITVDDICKEAKLENYIIQTILKEHFTEKFMNDRKSRIYRRSKLGDLNPMKQFTGENHPNYKGLVSDGQGYLMIKKPDWYTGRPKSFHVFYHSVVMCEHLNLTEIPKGFVVHHIDLDKHNNNINNLALMEIGAHTRLHQQILKMCKVQRLSEQE